MKSKYNMTIFNYLVAYTLQIFLAWRLCHNAKYPFIYSSLLKMIQQIKFSASGIK